MFGLVIWIGFHLVLMPIMGIVPTAWDQPWEEHFSEIFGHIFWLWVIEVFRRDMRNRISGQLDPEVQLPAAA